MVKTKPVIIAKTFLLSKLNYTILALPLSRDIAAQTDSIILGSCGRKKHCNKKAFEKIKRNYIYTRKHQTEGLVQ